MNKEIVYPWHLAPDWAQYAYIRLNGEAVWLGKGPSFIITKIKDWTPPENIDWTKSLQKRPRNE